MSSFQKYRESIGDGGFLCLTKGGWYAEWSFPGPDRRYNHTFLRLLGGQFRQIVEDYPAAFDRFETLKGTVPTGGELTEERYSGIKIDIGGDFEGVYLGRHRHIITDRETLNQRVLLYRAALVRAKDLEGGFTPEPRSGQVY